MKPEANGRYCQACCHTVVDFSLKAPHEILTILSKHKKESLCGYFKETQLNRPLSTTSVSDSVNITKRFTLALYLVFGSLLFSCKIVPQHEQKGPVFQKGRFMTRDLSSGSIHQKYGSTNYLDYLTPEFVDSVLTCQE
jgi:hypothetical protein